MLVKNFKLQNACALKYNNYYTLFHVYSLHQFLKYLEIPHFSCMQSLNDTAGGTASSSKGSKIILVK